MQISGLLEILATVAEIVAKTVVARTMDGPITGEDNRHQHRCPTRMASMELLYTLGQQLSVDSGLR